MQSMLGAAEEGAGLWLSWSLGFCFRVSLDLETAGGPQQGGNRDAGQRTLLFLGGESVGWFIPGGA